MITKKCKRCKKLYIVGETGMWNGLCDDCANVKRDQYGYAWYAWEQSQLYQPVDGSPSFEVFREEAFGGRHE